MLQHAILYIVIILVVLMLIMLSHKIKAPYPVVLIVSGLILGLIPFFSSVSIDPELVFIIFLPPLLYEAAWNTSWKEFWRWRRVIGSFAFLIVIVTSLLVAWVASTFIPGFTLALGFLLGGIVSPPDAVSATAILKDIKVPRRLSSILEGESLLNDASSLIVFRFALIAVSTGRFIFHEAVISFFLVIAGGVGIGLAIGYIFYRMHKWLPTDTNTDIVLTLLTPYVMYITAELLHVSGVLAVVTGGLFLSTRRHLFLNHSSRLKGTNVWSAIGFVLNGLVFILIGLELPVIVKGMNEMSLLSAIGYGVLITIVLIVARIASTLGASVFTVFISRYIETADNRPGWKAPLVFGWAGMRGVVSLAAALSIPVYVSGGVLFPQRNLIMFITFVVIFLTLLLQGLTLPLLIRLVKLKDPDDYMSEEDQYAKLSVKLSKASIAFLKEHYVDKDKHNPALEFLLIKWEHGRDMHIDAVLQADYQKACLHLIGQQRDWLMEWNESLKIDDGVIKKYLLLLDLEEEQLKVKFSNDSGETDY